MEGRNIPTDVLGNILLRIPASSLQRLKYVSKVWLQTISDPDFAEAHHTHQSREKFGWSFIIGATKDIVFIGDASSPSPNVPRRMYLPGVHGKTHVYGSYKGLVLFQCGTNLHVANPITGDNLSLPSFYGYSGSIPIAGIITGDNLSLPTFYGYSSSIPIAGLECVRDREIKVVVVARQGKKIASTPYICGVLNLGSRSWRKVHIPVQRHRLEPFVRPYFVAGTLHLICDTGILSLDLPNEKFHRIEVDFLSNSQLKYQCRIFEWEGCFAITSKLTQPINSLYIVWVLKESGWKKLHIDVAFFERLGCPCTVNLSSDLDRLYLVGTMRNGEVILFWQVSKGRMYLFALDLVCQAMTFFTQFEDNFTLPYLEQNNCYFSTYMNSLISCSSYDSPKRIGLCGEGTIKPALVLDLATKVLTYFGRTLCKLFKS